MPAIVEKSIKSILSAWGEFYKTHFISDVLRREIEERKLSEWEEKLTIIADIGLQIEPHVSLSRYQDIDNNKIKLPSEEYNPSIASNFLKKTKIVLEVTEKFIEWWFK
ncbi:HEPN domain-containing protein [Candidatus Poribacteria bacterium]|nr:HEPN domain-containing protein [Candidatus Poribacteria bacterium]